MDIPGLGEVTADEEFGWLVSLPVPVPMFGGKACRFVLEGYEDDEHKEDFHTAIANFLAAGPAVLREADEPLFRYYQDFEEYWLEDDNPPIKQADIWQHVRLGSRPMVSRRPYGDKGIYISIESECDWEEEHGLQLVLKNGQKVTKLGGYDGHLTHSGAFGNPRLEHVVYPTRESI